MKYSFKCFEDEVYLYLSRNHTMPKSKILLFCQIQMLVKKMLLLLITNNSVLLFQIR